MCGLFLARPYLTNEVVGVEGITPVGSVAVWYSILKSLERFGF